jgi:transcriptional regulator with XRE-family HTH domain
MIKSMGTKEMGRVIRDKRRGMTQEQIEELSGVSQGMISRLERGEIQRPNLEFVRAIAKAIDAPYEDLIGALHGSAMAAGTLDENEEIATKWSVMDIPPDVTTDELILLKHLFRAVRSYREEVEGPQIAPAGRRAVRSQAGGDGDRAEQPALVRVDPQRAEQG